MKGVRSKEFGYYSKFTEGLAKEECYAKEAHNVTHDVRISLWLLARELTGGEQE